MDVVAASVDDFRTSHPFNLYLGELPYQHSLEVKSTISAPISPFVVQSLSSPRLQSRCSGAKKHMSDVQTNHLFYLSNIITWPSIQSDFICKIGRKRKWTKPIDTEAVALLVFYWPFQTEVKISFLVLRDKRKTDDECECFSIDKNCFQRSRVVSKKLKWEGKQNGHRTAGNGKLKIRTKSEISYFVNTF